MGNTTFEVDKFDEFSIPGGLKAQLLHNIRLTREKGSVDIEVLDLMESLLLTDSVRLMSKYWDENR